MREACEEKKKIQIRINTKNDENNKALCCRANFCNRVPEIGRAVRIQSKSKFSNRNYVIQNGQTTPFGMICT